MVKIILGIISCLFLACNPVNALSTVNVNGLWFYLYEEEKTATLTKGWPLYSGDIIVPGNITYEGNTYSVTMIDGAFSTCKDLKSVTILEGVKSIGSYAFYGCKNLSAVYLPNGLLSIGEEAFEDCTKLSSLEIPNTVSEIGRGAFWNSGINNVNIPTSLEKIANVTFAGCLNLTQIVIPNNIKIIGSECFSGSNLKTISIPSSVEEIGYNAFNCANLETVVIEESDDALTFDGEILSSENSKVSKIILNRNLQPKTESNRFMPFYNQKKLTYVSIGEKVSSMDPEYFEGCFSIRQLRFEDGTDDLTLGNLSRVFSPFSAGSIQELYIGRNLKGMQAPFAISGIFSLTYGNAVTSICGLYNCTGLSSLSIPSSITSISLGVIPTENLSIITVAEGNPNYDSRNNCNAIIETKSNTLITGCSNTVIPTDINSIGSLAFVRCRQLYSITIPDNITSIANNAFNQCDNLTEVILYSNSIASQNYSTDKSFVAIFGPQVQNYLLGNGIKRIGSYAFSNCNNLLSVSIPEGLENIGSYAFSGCNSLSTITVPNSLLSIGSSAFYNCTKLTSVVFEDSEVMLDFQDGNTFYGCPLSDLYIGRNIKFTKNNSPFKNNREGIKSISLGEMITEISDDEFSGFKGLSSIKLPQNLQTIGSMAFYGCEGLTELTIPGSVTEIGQQAFDMCRNLKNLRLDDGKEVLMFTAESNYLNNAFQNSPLEEVYMGRNFSFTNSSPLAFFETLSSLTFGEEVSSIQTKSFIGCPSLKDVTSNSKIVPTTSDIVFTPSYLPTATLHVPYALYDEYKVANVWKDFGTIVNLEGLYNLIYSVDGEEYKKYVVEQGTTIISEEEPTKEGYTFSGWSEIPEIMPAHDVTVTGTFSLDTAIDQITTDSNSKAKIFTLDGKRIVSPKSGSVVIKKAGQKTVKVVVK